MEWWQRLQQWMNEDKISRPELARRADVDVELINKWLQGRVDNPRSSALRRVLDVLRRGEPELFYGISDAQLAQLRRLPVVDMRALGRLKRGQSPHAVWDGKDTTEGHRLASDDTIAVRLTDESCSFGGFHAGDLVIVDPAVEWAPRDFVIAVREDLQKAVFGRFSPLTFGTEYPFQVVPTDRDFPAIDFDDERRGFIVGRATKHIRDI